MNVRLETVPYRPPRGARVSQAMIEISPSAPEKCSRCRRECPPDTMFFGQYFQPPSDQWYRRNWCCGHKEITCGPCFDSASAAGCSECGRREEHT